MELSNFIKRLIRVVPSREDVLNHLSKELGLHEDDLFPIGTDFDRETVGVTVDRLLSLERTKNEIISAMRGWQRLNLFYETCPEYTEGRAAAELKRIGEENPDVFGIPYDTNRVAYFMCHNLPSCSDTEDSLKYKVRGRLGAPTKDFYNAVRKAMDE